MATSPSSSGFSHLRSNSVAGVTSGVLNNLLASVNIQFSGGGYLLVSMFSRMDSILLCFLISSIAFLGPIPLILVKLKSFQYIGQVKLLDWHLPRFREGQVAK